MGYDKQRVEWAIDSLKDCRGDHEAVQELLEYSNALERERKSGVSMTAEMVMKTEPLASSLDDLNRRVSEAYCGEIPVPMMSAIKSWLKSRVEVRTTP